MKMLLKEDVETKRMISKEDLMELARFHNSFCISIYIPTHRAGENTLKGEDHLNLKNQLKIVRHKLEQRGMKGSQPDLFTSPIKNLVNDNTFWRHQSDGLALFLSDDFFRIYNIPVSFGEVNYVSSEFYLKPLLPLFNDDGLFYMLTIKKDEVKFFEGSKYNISEIDIHDIVPSRLEDRVGYDFEQKQLQFRTKTGNNTPGSFHGHGESETREKDEILLYFQSIDKGIMSKIRDSQDIPLVVCCLDYFFPIYKEANTHKNLFPQHVSCNPANMDPSTLHLKARELLQPHLNQHLHKKKNRLLQELPKGKASLDINEILPSAIQGRVDTLFLEKSAELYGVFDQQLRKVKTSDNKELPNVSLMNLAAKKCFEQGGIVYLLDRLEMPDKSSDMNALFRY